MTGDVCRRAARGAGSHATDSQTAVSRGARFFPQHDKGNQRIDNQNDNQHAGYQGQQQDAIALEPGSLFPKWSESIPRGARLIIHSTILEVSTAGLQQFRCGGWGFPHGNSKDDSPGQDTNVVSGDEGVDGIVHY